MGCDIHFHVESKGTSWNPEEWVYEGVLYSRDRNYRLFAELADVRSGGEIEPIAEPRGLPQKISYPVEDDFERWKADAHSTTWLTLSELQARKATGNHCESVFWSQTVPILEAIAKIRGVSSEAIRCVFWFDN